MESNLLIVDVLINGYKFTPILVDLGCSYYIAIDSSFAASLGLKRIRIEPRLLERVAEESQPDIKEIICFDIDINGHKRKMIYAYIIKDLNEPLILRML